MEQRPANSLLYPVLRFLCILGGDNGGLLASRPGGPRFKLSLNKPFAMSAPNLSRFCTDGQRNPSRRGQRPRRLDPIEAVASTEDKQEMDDERVRRRLCGYVPARRDRVEMETNGRVVTLRHGHFFLQHFGNRR